jgi:hypothetical protein
MRLPITWVLKSPSGNVLWFDNHRPPPDFRYPEGSSIKAPGMTDFLPLAGGYPATGLRVQAIA